MQIDLSQFYAVFFEESLEGLDSMEQELLSLEEDADSEKINKIFRVAHSIKGGSATFNFNQIADFTHVLETLLDQMRAGSRAVNRQVIDMLLQSVDVLRNMLIALQNESPVDDSYKSLLSEFEKLLAGDSAQTDDDKDSESESQKSAVLDSPESLAIKSWNVRFAPEEYILETGNEPYRMFRELKSLGFLKVEPDFSQVPDFESINPESCYLSWQLELEADVDELAIREVFEWIEDDCELIVKSIVEKDSSSDINQNDETKPSVTDQVKDGATEVQTVESALRSASSDKSDSNETDSTKTGSTKTDKSKSVVTVPETKKSQTSTANTQSNATIRVATDKVDTLIDLVGELVITQSMLGELGSDFNMTKINALLAGLVELEQNTRELQESVMRIRMLPIGFIFNRLPRMVRDLSNQLGKKVNIEIAGESTELDKTVMENIGDPLTHLVRNALDHGLESGEDRIALGKSEEGNLSLNAFHQGGSIIVEVKDDGKGIDPEIIRKKAIEREMISESEELSESQVLALIMEPGFSTAAQISEISGRGVGLDVVKRNINKLGGSIEIDSELGEGTTFTIRLPLTLAILDGQLVKVEDETYVLPLVSIIESVPVSEKDIEMVAGNVEVYKFRNEYVPIVNLREEFGLSKSNESNENSLLAIVEGENRKIALRVSSLLGQQQVVIKSLESHYKSIQGISGATILGNGNVALILDVVGLARRSSSKQKGNKRVA